MQDYLSIAEKNGFTLSGEGPCQCCGAATVRGIHECVEVFSLGFESIDYGQDSNHRYRFLGVDAHTLQHPEIHGRWNNHFHLTRQRLMLSHGVKWTYQHSPLLSDFLKRYKAEHPDEVLTPPALGARGELTATDVLACDHDEQQCKAQIEAWAAAVHRVWEAHHPVVERLAQGFLETYPQLTPS